MAARTAIGKIGKIDFFACLPSGAYAFLCLYLVFSIVFGFGVDSERVVDDGKVAFSVKAAESEKTIDFEMIVDSKATNDLKKEVIGSVNKNPEIWNAINKLIKKTTSEPTSLLLIIFASYILGSVFRAFPVKNAEILNNYPKSEFPYAEEIIKQINRIKNYATIWHNMEASRIMGTTRQPNVGTVQIQ